MIDVSMNVCFVPEADIADIIWSRPDLLPCSHKTKPHSTGVLDFHFLKTCFKRIAINQALRSQ